MRIKTKIMQNNIVLLKENNPIIAAHLQMMLDDAVFWAIHIDKADDLTTLCEYFKPICIIWSESGAENKQHAQSIAAMRADLGIPILAIKSLGLTESSFLEDFVLYDKVLYKPFSSIQLKHFLAYLQKIPPVFFSLAKKAV